MKHNKAAQKTLCMLKFHKQRRDGGRLSYFCQANWAPGLWSAQICSSQHGLQRGFSYRKGPALQHVEAIGLYRRHLSDIAKGTLQPHTFSKRMRRQAKGQLRVSAEKFSTDLLLLSSAKKVTFWRAHCLSPLLAARGHPSWCPCSHQRPSQSPQGFWSGLQRVTIIAGVFLS